jgi:hypothetical protein
MGYGSVGFQAMNQDRRFIGTEIEQQVFDVANTWLPHEYRTATRTNIADEVDEHLNRDNYLYYDSDAEKNCHKDLTHTIK